MFVKVGGYVCERERERERDRETERERERESEGSVGVKEDLSY